MKIKSGNELDWEMAREAAEHIVQVCKDAGFVPPEAVDLHVAKITEICIAMDSIVDALRLRHGSGGPAKRVEPAVTYYCSACHRDVETCNHSTEDRDAWRRELSLEPWQRQHPPGRYATCPNCKSPTLTLYGTSAGRCYACGTFDRATVEGLQ